MKSCDCSCGCQSKSQENTGENLENLINNTVKCPACNTISKVVPADVSMRLWMK